MTEAAKIAFTALARSKGAALVAFVGADLKAGERVSGWLAPLAGALATAAEAAAFKGKAMSALDILAPSGLDAPRLVVVGVAPGKDAKPLDFVLLGGFVAGKLAKA